MRGSQFGVVIALALGVQPSTAAGRDQLRGCVVNAVDQPLRSAAVELHRMLPNFQYYSDLLAGRAPSPTQSVQTNHLGCYSLSMPSVGLWRVVVRASDYLTMQYMPVTGVGSVELPPVRLPKAERPGENRRRFADFPPGLILFAAITPTGVGSDYATDGWQIARRVLRTSRSSADTLPQMAGEELTLALVNPATKELRTPVDPAAYVPNSAPHGDGRYVIELRDQGGGVIAGAVVCAGEGSWPIGLTGQDGRITLLSSADRLLVRAWLPDGRAIVERINRSRSPITIVLPDLRSITGQITNAYNDPLPGVLVWPTHDAGRFAISDANGEYAIPRLIGGRFQIQAEATGYTPRLRRISDSEVAAGRVGIVRLARAFELTGEVFDPFGRPIVGAVIQATMRGAKEWVRGDDAESRSATDTQGRFRLSGLQAGRRHELLVTAPGYAIHRQAIRAEGEQGALRVEMAVGQKVQGKVLRENHEPVAGARVTLRRKDGDSFSDAEIAEGRTDVEGRFGFRVPFAMDAAELEVDAFGFAPALLAKAAFGRDRPIDFGTIVLDHGASLNGIVLDEAARPLAGASIWVTDEAPAGRPSEAHVDQRRRPNAVSGGDGTFSVQGLQHNRLWRVDVAAPGHMPRSIRRVEAGSPPRTRIVLRPGASYAGRLVDEQGQAVARGRIVLQPDGTPIGPAATQQSREAVTDSSGRFLIEGLTPGPYRAVVSAPGYRRLAPSIVLEGRVDHTAEPYVLLRGATIVGRVLTSAGRPVGDARVSVGDASSVSISDGSFRLEGVSTGLQVLLARHEEFGEINKSVEASLGEARIELRFQKGASISGRVVDEAGRPVASVVVGLATQRGRRAQYEATASSAGDFQFVLVRPGVYHLSVVGEGYRPFEDVLKIDENEQLRDLEVIVSRGAAVLGDVRGLGDLELSRVTVKAFSQQGGTMLMATGYVDADGRYEISGLGIGQWQIVAMLDRGARLTHSDVTIWDEFERVIQDLQFREGLHLSGEVRLAGVPLEGARVILQGMEEWTARRSATDSGGQFRIRDVEPGSYTVLVSHPRERLVYRRPLSMTKNEHISIGVNPARVSGRVVSGEDSSAIVDALVTAYRQDAGRSGSVVTASTSADGVFVLPRLMPGRYHMLVRKAGWAPLDQEIAVTRSSEALELTLTPSPH